MKKVFALMFAACCAMALSATTYTCHLKVTINGESAEQDQVQVDVNKANGLYSLSLKNFCLTIGEAVMPVGNIEVTDVEGVDAFGYTTINYNAPITITPGNDGVHQTEEWVGPMLGEVPIELTARFIDDALSANIDIELAVMGQTIGVSLFGVAPVLEGDVNHDGEVNNSDINALVDIILSE